MSEKKYKSDESRQKAVDALVKGRETKKKKQEDVIIQYNKSPNLCEFCKRPIDFYVRNENRFCSQSCAAKVNNIGIAHNGNRTPAQIVFCAFCGKPAGKNKKYCSRVCSTSATKKPISQLKQQKNIRFRLMEEREHVCVICGNSKWMDNEIPLVLDHIDGNPSNNSVDNLRFVCCNCDAQLPTYKGRNRGHGRFLRAQRARDGKSY